MPILWPLQYHTPGPNSLQPPLLRHSPLPRWAFQFFATAGSTDYNARARLPADLYPDPWPPSDPARHKTPFPHRSAQWHGPPRPFPPHPKPPAAPVPSLDSLHYTPWGAPCAATPRPPLYFLNMS